MVAKERVKPTSYLGDLARLILKTCTHARCRSNKQEMLKSTTHFYPASSVIGIR